MIQLQTLYLATKPATRAYYDNKLIQDHIMKKYENLQHHANISSRLNQKRRFNKLIPFIKPLSKWFLARLMHYFLNSF